MWKELTLPETYSEQLNSSKPLAFSTKSSILNILLGPENASRFIVFTYFHQKLHLRSSRGLICLCICLVRQFWRWINEICKVCYEETQNNSNKYVVSENSCLKNFIQFQEKHSHETSFLNKVAGYPTLTGNVLLGNLLNFQNSFSQNGFCSFCNSLPLENVLAKIHFSKISHSILLIYVLTCVHKD